MGRPAERKKGLKREGEVSDREKAKCVWESFGAEVHCGRANSVSGGSEVWINASDWRRAAAVVREQNIRQRGEERERRELEDGKGTDAEFWNAAIRAGRIEAAHAAPGGEGQ